MSETEAEAAPRKRLIPEGWTPTGSTLIGGGTGILVGQVVAGLIEYFGGKPLGDALSMAIGQLIVIAVGYFHRDGGRR